MIFFLNILSIIIASAAIFIIIFSIALIKASKNSTHANNNSIENKLKEAISRTRRIKLKAEADISRLQLMASQTLDTALAGTGINNLTTEQILQNPQILDSSLSGLLDEQTLEKTKQLLFAYKAQIELKKQEIQTAEKLQNKYSLLLEQLREAKQKQKISSRLDSQKQKLIEIQENINTQKDLFTHQYSYDMLASDAQQQIQFINALEELQNKYANNTLLTNTSLYQKDLQKITQQLDDQSQL